MSAIISEQIALQEPKGATLVIVRNEEKGTLTFALQVNSMLISLKADTPGWRALSLAIGTPPAPEFIPTARQCRVCGKVADGVLRFAAANLCGNCLGKPIPMAFVTRGGAHQ